MEAERDPLSPGDDALRASLLGWFAERRRDLPWRRTRDPYAVWVSESMLQQTRVETVIPYYERFLERFPSIPVLASAREEEVLALWSGLGYYRRARALLAAARLVVERHAGRFPRERADALALPGVGRYTAGAVLSIAYGRPEPLVDGNVARVFARLFALAGAHGSGALTRAAWQVAERLVAPPVEGTDRGGPGFDPGEWNQALMELGALVCTARSPACDACPLVERCAAHRTGRVDELPEPAVRRATLDVELEVLLVARGDALLLTRRPRTGRMAGLWELPTRERSADPTGLWPARYELPGDLRVGGELLSARHSITHHRIKAFLRRASWRPAPGRERGVPQHDWIAPRELAGVALTGLTKKLFAGLDALEDRCLDQIPVNDPG